MSEHWGSGIHSIDLIFRFGVQHENTDPRVPFVVSLFLVHLGIALLTRTRHSAWLMMVISLAMVHTCGLCVAQPAPDEGGVQPVGKVEEVKTGFTFTEGPAWSQQGALFFTDIPNAKIHLLSEKSNALRTFSSDSGHANGILVDASNRILVCQMDGRVVQYDANTAKYKVLADKYEGKRFNAPNDLIVDKLGGIYFTDPLFRAPHTVAAGYSGCVLHQSRWQSIQTHG